MREKILHLLKKYPQEHVSGEKLSEQLGVSRTAIWKHINALREEGYNIESIPRKGYILRESPDILTAVEIQGELHTSLLGKKIMHFDSIGSTNDKAKDLALQGAEEGTVIIAEEQIKGRGRRGSQWVSPKGKGIWMSIILRPDVLPKNAPKFTLLSAVAVAQAIREVTALPVQIKWPNDIIYQNKKVCGILTEMSAEMDFINYIVVGMGININESIKDFPEEIQGKATSLREIKGENISRQRLVRSILENLEKFYLEFVKEQNFQKVLELWKSMSGILGKEVRAMGNNDVIQGIAVDINQEGALIIKEDNGKIHEITFGEVSLRGVNGYI
ncbi:biotin--[acetyl-CoA-carboxylase] ligase [Irregularibacter muris]|uniref:Bifunctional ligase/repressor BirA n=1 Tax=Irregularibacter muris TaxID=1796619 RepID=A0AAE3L3Y4_9FIRM|nr:biotin--[acetyl-CoA-carboxylase] ligase [Irregularibacter muris]MCR1899058.1 biotin--[acetyl-CoA-carboxylase] ligase [Irregularibacter muris]